MTRGVIQPERSPQVTDLLIRQKAEVMILWAYTALRQFPKWERHVLAAEMRRTLWNLLRLIVVCNKKYFKKTTLQELDAEIDLLRSQVRLAKDLGYLDFRRYEHWSRLNDEIGRMLGGWIKAMSANQAGDPR